MIDEDGQIDCYRTRRLDLPFIHPGCNMRTGDSLNKSLNRNWSTDYHNRYHPDNPVRKQSMQQRETINTDQAPSAIGTYSQAVRVDKTVYISGQIPLDPNTMEVVGESFAESAHQTFKNLHAVCTAAGGNLENITKLNIYVTDLSEFPILNEVMSEYFTEPYPARAVVGVAALPKDVPLEIEAVMVLG